MFKLFPNQWTPAAPLSELTTNPAAVEVAGERIVLFKDNDGAWHALLDHCPHRGAQLSLGKVTDNGELRCGYHGWRYDGSGRCTNVPLNILNDKAMAKIRATALPTRTMAGAVWIYTATHPNGADVPEPVLPDSLQHDAWQYITFFQKWKAHWTRAQENFIDFAHPPYLHQATIGMYLHEYAENGGEAKAETTPTDYGMTMVDFVGAADYEGFRLDWYRPNLSVLHFGTSPSNRLHIFCIPINEQLTRVMTVRYVANMEPGDSYSKHASGADQRIFDEDRVIVESQRGDVLSDPAEISVATDEPTLLFRRWYQHELIS